MLIFSEGIFASETYIAYPADKGASRISIPLLMPKDIPYDINIKALVGTDHSQQFHVFELTRQLPRFSMYAMREDAYDGSKKGIISHKFLVHLTVYVQQYLISLKIRKYQPIIILNSKLMKDFKESVFG